MKRCIRRGRMEKELLGWFRSQLEEKRNAILNEAGKTLSEMTDQNTNVPDPNDRASIESDRSFELRIRERERKLLSKIEEALERVEDGSFGICEACGEEIGVKRLEARPVTTLCIDCKTLQETEEKAQGQ
jgi:DnaK suppressor protein